MVPPAPPGRPTRYRSRGVLAGGVAAGLVLGAFGAVINTDLGIALIAGMAAVLGVGVKSRRLGTGVRYGADAALGAVLGATMASGLRTPFGTALVVTTGTAALAVVAGFLVRRLGNR